MPVQNMLQMPQLNDITWRRIFLTWLLYLYIINIKVYYIS
ncbi:hypothetical protein E1757_29105 [Paenibacillus piri]|uniref:Uncharacterized protein n=1 Tax=Paenibacillus piri TaxID=2547395 RepID=A0A4R5KCB7_9BACL|nr:hypothetical protein E1757_29105 [Paenibacillus piri]